MIYTVSMYAEVHAHHCRSIHTTAHAYERANDTMYTDTSSIYTETNTHTHKYTHTRTHTKDWLDVPENAEKWCEGKLTASERRVLVTQWFGEAVTRVEKTFPFQRVFEKYVCVGVHTF